MLTPAATAARTASDPEWKKVPSPMFCDVVLASGERSQPGPLRPFTTHLGHPHLMPPAGGIEAGHDVAADAQADQLVVAGPGGDVVRDTPSRTPACGPAAHRRAVPGAAAG